MSIDNASRVGRPIKKGLDYFAHLVKHTDEESILFKKYGCNGYAAYYVLREKITENGYFYELTDKKILLLCSDYLNIERVLFDEILQFALELGLFDKGLFEKYAVLTSERLQIDYIIAASRRKQIDFFSEYFLISDNVMCSEIDNSTSEKLNFYSISDNNNSINANRNTQSKRKSKSNSNSERKRKSESESESKQIEKISAKENGKGNDRESAERGSKEKPQIDVSELSDEEYKALFHQ